MCASITQAELDAMAAGAADGELSPRQRLVLCLVLLRGGNAATPAWAQKGTDPFNSPRHKDLRLF